MSTNVTSRVLARPLRRSSGGPPLFFITAPEVSALGYVALGRRLPPAESPYCVQARRGAYPTLRREYEPEEISALAADYLASVRAVQPEGPYLLAGMCAGGHIAFEMARQLESEGEQVALLAMLDTWPVENSSYYPLVLLEALRRRFRRPEGAPLLGWLWRSARQAIARLVQKLQPGLSATPELARWRARMWPGPGFVPARFGGEITVLRARRQAYYRVRDPMLGWGTRTDGPVRVLPFPGDHESMLRAPNVDAVAALLARCLVRSRWVFRLHGPQARGAAAPAALTRSGH